MNIKTRQEPVHVMEFSTAELEALRDFLRYAKECYRGHDSVPGQYTVEEFYSKIAGVLR